ncbi:tetratricopeptide repeat protein [Chryseobacterium sp. SIMBA_029]|uniref:tetratricopeptide repeat protein n=1 Tax=Chryseobacterium sp. SIMBA_029 TaxID=3085772 RepID=UPI00397BD054
MDSKEVKQQLSEAKKHKNNGYFAEALEILHQINNEFPNNPDYRYLLAATYYESMNTDAGKKYAEETLKIDSQYKQAYELLGDVYTKENNLGKAQENYEKASDLDIHYMTVDEKLIQLYLKTKNYEGVLRVCNNMMNYIHVDVSTAKSRALTSVYLGCVLYKGWALVYLKRYEEAINEIKRRKELNMQIKYPSYFNQYKDDDEALFKMYYQLKNTAKIGEYRKKMKEEYQLTNEEITKLEEEARQNIILFRQRPENMAYLGLT